MTDAKQSYVYRYYNVIVGPMVTILVRNLKKDMAWAWEDVWLKYTVAPFWDGMDLDHLQLVPLNASLNDQILFFHCKENVFGYRAARC